MMRAQQKSGPLYMSAKVQHLPWECVTALKPFDLRKVNHVFFSRPGSYLADGFRRMMQAIAKNNNDFDIMVRWVLGHIDIHGNEEVDKHAKRVAENRESKSPRQHLPHYLRLGTLPLSISAPKQAHTKQTHAHWGRIWRRSPRYARTNHLDPNLIHRSFIKLVAHFPKRLTSLYISLRSQHIPLNKYLYRIGKKESPHCEHCPQTDETVHHFILECQHYQRQRHTLTCALGRKALHHPSRSS